MDEAERDEAQAVPEHLRPPIRACLDGRAPINIALMRLLVEARSDTEVDLALAATLAEAERSRSPERAARLRRLQALHAEHPSAFATVKAVMLQAAHNRAASPEQDAIVHWRGVFDRLAADLPEAGVALYALGSPESTLR